MAVFQLHNKQNNSNITITPDDKGLSISSPEASTFHVDYWKVVNCYIDDEKVIYLSVLLSEHNNELVDFYGIANDLDQGNETLIQDIRSKSKLKSARRLKALVNPVGGTGKAVDYYVETVAPILKTSGCIVDMQVLEYKRHAFDIAKALELEYDAVVCVSGDGILHEVLNGFLHHQTPSEAFKMPLCPVPGGSGNGISVCVLGAEDGLDLSIAALNAAKGDAIPLDLFSIWQDGKRTLSYLTQAAGLMASIDIGTENLRWMGDTRFTVGYLRSLFWNAPCPCEIYIKVEEDNKDEMIKLLHEKRLEKPFSLPEYTQIPPVTYKNGPQQDWIKISDDVFYLYAGQVPWVSKDLKQFPVSMPNDGFIDVAVQLNVSRMHKLKAMDGAEHGAMFFDDSLKYYKAKAYHFNPLDNSGYLAADGEQIPLLPFTVEVLPSLGRLISPFTSWNNSFQEDNL
ncbi:hypothetical protein E3P92_02180 [Wallemia ichthyophaga]|nr:hypothetical protein E3P91_01931 [Wallemia ichthyophaga]TIB13682.1 hypothetical protein E3P92_02180 [Wallemia ichthyophaga]